MLSPMESSFLSAGFLDAYPTHRKRPSTETIHIVTQRLYTVVKCTKSKANTDSFTVLVIIRLRRTLSEIEADTSSITLFNGVASDLSVCCASGVSLCASVESLSFVSIFAHTASAIRNNSRIRLLRELDSRIRSLRDSAIGVLYSSGCKLSAARSEEHTSELQ